MSPQSSEKMAEFRFLGYLAEVYGKKRIKIPLENPRKLRDILEVEFPEDRSIVLVNQRVGNFDSLIRNGDTIVIMPMISGGQPKPAKDPLIRSVRRFVRPSRYRRRGG
jgi:molybdopterin converting factor small subunit